MNRESSDYKDYAPYIDGDTTVGEIVDYTKRQTKDPLEYNGCTVYDYSSHHHDPLALDEITREVANGKYVIPFQVPTAFCFIWDIIPLRIKRDSQFFIYRSHEEEYVVYRNFMNQDRVTQWELDEYREQLK